MEKYFNIVAVFTVLTSLSWGEIFDPRDHHYEFAHKVLVKEMAQAEFAETLKKKKVGYLKRLWRVAQKQAKDGKKLSSKGLDYKVFNLGEDHEVVVVILPEAEVTAEAHMVGVEYKDGKMVGSIYTLEKGFERLVLGGWSEGRHLNFGEGPANDPEKFREVIVKNNKG